MNKLQAIDIWLSLQKKFPNLIITAHPHSNGDWYVKVQEPEYRGVVTIFIIWSFSDYDQFLNNSQLVSA